MANNTGWVSSLRFTRAEYDRVKAAMRAAAHDETWESMLIVAEDRGAVSPSVWAAWALLQACPDWYKMVSGLYDRNLSDRHIESALLRICRGLS